MLPANMNSVDIIDLTDPDSRIIESGKLSSAAEPQSATNGKAEIIDLTIQAIINNDSGAINGPHSDKKSINQRKNTGGRRGKKRKRAFTDGSSLSSAIQTREHSVEDGENRNEISSSSPSKNFNSKVQEEDQQLGQRSRESKRRSRTPSLPPIKPPTSLDDGGLFYVDLQPSQLQSSAIVLSSHLSQEKTSDSLLLPTHVSIFGSEPVQIIAPATTEIDEDYIDYLDIDDSNKNIVRYFDNPTDETTKPTRIVCKHCGAEGEHSTASCPVLICLTCGARNEHSTRSCPISKTCYTCGMKGHINATCPNRKAAKRGEMGGYDDCDRCGSELHKANECPTLWRLYEYLTEESRKSILQTRKQKQNMSLGQGGEGYIADDEWCYNCASYGHWGDDCKDFPHRDDVPDESSAFSEHNTLSGPFVDSVMDRTASRPPLRGKSSRGLPNELLESWGSVPDNVGRKGRMDNSAKMRRKAREQAMEDDPDDWFGNPRNIRNSGVSQSNRSTALSSPKKLTFGKPIQESKNFRQHSPPSLLQRIGDRYAHDDLPSEYQPRDRRYSSKSNRHHSNVSRQDDRQRGRNGPGPRYRGGYQR